MGGLGRAFAGALQGLGAGITAQAQSREEERRQIALENLRQANRSAEMTQQADLNDRNAERSDERSDTYDARKTGRQTNAEITVVKARGEVEGGLAAAADGRRAGIEAEQLRLKSKLDRGDFAFSKTFEASIQQGLAKGEIERVVEGDGQSTIIFKDGRTQSVETPGSRATGSSGGATPSVLDEARGGAAAPVAAREPPRAQAPQRPRPQASKTMSRADVKETARSMGMSERDAQLILEKRGYRLAD